MLIKIFAHGTNGGDAPINYITAVTLERKHMPPIVLKNGNPDLTRDLINSIERKWTYTSGVISFHVDDKPTEQEQLEVIECFEETMFAGLEEDQYNILWVRHQHTEGERVELHFVTPRMELISGRSLNIAPPRSEKFLNALQTVLNLENNWADPNDPSRAQKLTFIRDSKGRPETREEIAQMIDELVQKGEISNRDDVIKVLEGQGYKLNRKNENYISVKDTSQPDQKPIRLKGIYFTEAWQNDTLAHNNVVKYQDNKDTALADAQLALSSNIERRMRYNQKRYSYVEDLTEYFHYNFRDIENSFDDFVANNEDNKVLFQTWSEQSKVFVDLSIEKSLDNELPGDNEISRSPFELPSPYELLDPFAYYLQIQTWQNDVTDLRKSKQSNQSYLSQTVLPNDEQNKKAALLFYQQKAKENVFGSRTHSKHKSSLGKFGEWLREKVTELYRKLREKLEPILKRDITTVRSFEEKQRNIEQKSGIVNEQSKNLTREPYGSREKSVRLGEPNNQLQGIVGEIKRSLSAIEANVEVIASSFESSELKQEPEPDQEEPYYGGGMSM